MQAVLFDAFGTLYEISEKRNLYKPSIKAWPSGVADACQALMTRDSSPAELAGEAGRTSQAIMKMKEGIAAKVASMCLYPEVRASLELLKQRSQKWAIVSNLATPLCRTALETAPLCSGRLRVVFRRGQPEAAGKHLSPCLQGAGD